MKKILFVFLLAFTANIFSQGTWTLQTSGISTDIFSCWATSADICWMCGPNKVLRTTNGGTTWASIPGISGNLYTICGLDVNNAWVGADDGTIWRTTNGGTTWTFSSNAPPTFVDVVHFFDVNTGFYIGDPANGNWRYYITTNGGTNWTFGANAPTATGTEAGWNGGYAAIDTGHIWITTNNSKIYKGSFRGPFTSAPVGLNSFGAAFTDVNTGVAVINNGTNALANTKTTNGGTSWANTSYTPSSIPYGIKSPLGSNYYWISATNNILRSTDGGNVFVSQFTLPASSAGYCISMYSINAGWVGTQGGKIYKYTDNVGISGNNNEIPKSYSLEQNYPNPFNPTTTINYSLPYSSDVTLKIYDITGNVVTTLVNGYKTAGKYLINIDASSLSSGIYFYTLRAGEFVQSKKMMLVK